MSRQKILILTERFAPEEFLINDLAREWKSRGYDVEVLTQVPSYPFDKIFDGYRNKLFQTTRELNEIPVHRVRTILGYNRKVSLKILNYLSFAFLTMVWGLFCGWRYKRVFIYHTGPLTMASASLVLHYVWRRKCTIWTQDMWPEAVYAYGFRKTGFREKLLNAFVRLIYSASDCVLVSCPGFVKVLSRRIKKPVTFIPQWDIGGRELAPKEPGGKHIFMFTGNHGVPQILDQVIQGFAAAQLENAELHLVGGGVKLEELQALVREKSIRNVVFHGRQPHSLMKSFLSKADVLLLPLSEKFSLTLPGKFPAYLKAGRPIMGVIKGEAANYIKSEQLGLVASPRSVESIAEVFQAFNRCLMSDRKQIETYQKNCQTLSRESFNRETGVSKLLNMLWG